MKKHQIKQNNTSSTCTTCTLVSIDECFEKHDIAALIKNSTQSINASVLNDKYSLLDNADKLDFLPVVNTVTSNLGACDKESNGKEVDNDFISLWAQISVVVAKCVLQAGGNDKEANCAAKAVLTSGWNSAANNCSGVVAINGT